MFNYLLGFSFTVIIPTITESQFATGFSVFPVRLGKKSAAWIWTADHDVALHATHEAHSLAILRWIVHL